MKLKDEQRLYVRSMGKLLRVTAIFQDDATANDWLERNSDDAVVAVFGHYVLTAKKYDKGVDAPQMA